MDACVEHDVCAGEVVGAMGSSMLTDQTLCLGFVALGWGHLVGVVAVADLAFKTEPVEGSPGAAAAVVAADINRFGAARGNGSGSICSIVRLVEYLREETFERLLVFWHWLCTDLVVKFAPLEFHVDGAFAADRALVRDFHEILVALAMHVVAAWHANSLLLRLEQVIETKRAVAFRSSFHARMRRRSGDGDADVALLTVNKILSQPLSNAANAAFIAMVDPSIAVVIPELALLAVIVSCVFLAVHAYLCCWLWCTTEHA